MSSTELFFRLVNLILALVVVVFVLRLLGFHF